MVQQFQVVIIGGRVAGCALAIRLGKAGIKTLVVERDKLPSLPAVSCPIIFEPTMKLMDELGISEDEYAFQTPKIREFVFEGENIFVARHTIPEKNGRDYAYAVDREQFDAALWNKASHTPNVTVWQQTSVIDLLSDGVRVSGVKVKNLETGDIQQVESNLVVGADGRSSFTARKLNAQEFDHKTRYHSSVYYAYWRNVEPFDSEPIIHLFRGTGRYGVLMLDSADDTTSVLVEGHPSIFSRGSSTDIYHSIVQSHASIQRRLKNAQLATSVRGMRNVRHIYRQAGGHGWALVGDAIHQKDPLDGQGIYNTLFSVNLLAEAIEKFFDGHDWQSLMDLYAKHLRVETEPMLKATIQRIAREVYTTYPVWFGRTVGRWVFANEAYLDRWIRLMIRDLAPENWFPASVILDGLFKGIARDLRINE